MILKHFKYADVIVENDSSLGYYFIDQGHAIFIRKNDMSNSYTMRGADVDLWEDLEDMLNNEYFNVVKGVDLVNQHTNH